MDRGRTETIASLVTKMPFSFIATSDLVITTNTPLLFMRVRIGKVSSVYCWTFKLRAHAFVYADACEPIFCVCVCLRGMCGWRRDYCKSLKEETGTGHASGLEFTVCVQWQLSMFASLCSVRILAHQLEHKQLCHHLTQAHCGLKTERHRWSHAVTIND